MAVGDELLTIRIGDQEFGIDIMAVREIRGWVGSTSLPHSPSYVRGVVNLRGAVLPILDLPNRLGLHCEEPSSKSVVVVVEVAGALMGLLVEAVCDILTIERDMLQAVPELGMNGAGGAVRGLLTVGPKIVGILDLTQVVPATNATADAA
jgi:purine-binding chemotaxis protein CheW